MSYRHVEYPNIVVHRAMVTVVVRKPDDVSDDDFDTQMEKLYEEVGGHVDVRDAIRNSLTDPKDGPLRNYDVSVFVD